MSRGAPASVPPEESCHACDHNALNAAADRAGGARRPGRLPDRVDGRQPPPAQTRRRRQQAAPKLCKPTRRPAAARPRRCAPTAMKREEALAQSQTEIAELTAQLRITQAQLDEMQAGVGDTEDRLNAAEARDSDGRCRSCPEQGGHCAVERRLRTTKDPSHAPDRRTRRSAGAAQPSGRGTQGAAQRTAGVGRPSRRTPAGADAPARRAFGRRHGTSADRGRGRACRAEAEAILRTRAKWN